MCDNNTQKLQIPDDYEFDENEDCVLPDTIWGEFILIFYMIKDLLKSSDKDTKFRDLKRQIRIYLRWLQVR